MEEEIRKEFMEMIKLLDEGKLQEFKLKATECPPVDIAEGLEEIEDEGRVLRVFRMLPKDISSDVFSYMTSEQQQLIAESATNAELKALVDDMFMDDTVDFLEEMPANVVKKVLQNADEGTRKTINQFLNYPENSAGSLMTIEYVDLHDYFTVRKAMDYIRRTGIDKETVYTCYVIDDQRRLVGQVSLRKLIIAPESACIRDIMDTNIVSAATTDDQEAVADDFRRYDLTSIAVCDKENRLVGIITIDDIVDVIQDENTEDIKKMAAIIPSDEDYMKTSVWSLVAHRLPWLMLLMISATFTSTIITHFETLLSGAVLLTCQSYAAGYSTAGVLRWYMVLAAFAAALCTAGVLGVPLRALRRGIRTVLRLPGRILYRFAVQPVRRRRAAAKTARKLRRNAERTAKKSKKNLPNQRALLYNSNVSK